MFPLDSGNGTVKGPEEGEDMCSRGLEKGHCSWRGSASLRCKKCHGGGKVEGANFRETQGESLLKFGSLDTSLAPSYS